MLPPGRTNEIEDFLGQVPHLTLDDFAQVNTVFRASYVVRKLARPILRLSAADHSWLDKRVRDVLAPMHIGWGQQGFNMTSVSIDVVVWMAQAIIRRDRLTREQYDAFANGFRQVGVTVPMHPSQEAEARDRAASIVSLSDQPFLASGKVD